MNDETYFIIDEQIKQNVKMIKTNATKGWQTNISERE